MSLCCRLLQNCNDDSLNVALPMRMLEVFSSENTYMPVLQDANYVVSVIAQTLHYVIQNGEPTEVWKKVSTITGKEHGGGGGQG
ncbi:ubiquitin-protein ligase E3C-like isoform X2 [Lemur catta]|nr:ubiquitin-protein ligase E3C-like isoform X2 [Lemur catta]